MTRMQLLPRSVLLLATILAARAYGAVEGSQAFLGLSSSSLDVHALGFDAFTTLRHPLYPRHSVRVKKTKHCDGEVNAYSGYVDVEAKHLWFEFFESRNDPAKDDFVFWTNGGPGCSSAVGLYMEHGPCLILNEEGLKRNPYSWNERANILYIHQPVNVGFSYAEHGESVGTTEEAAADIAAFMSILVDSEHFAHLGLTQPGRRLHMAGESYGGRYIPAFTAAILDDNARRVQAGHAPIAIESVLLGNGLVDFAPLVPGYYEMQCTAVSGVAPSTSVSSCVRMKQALPRCQKWLKAGCQDSYDEISCGAALGFCMEQFTSDYRNAGRNSYDITGRCEPVEEDNSCYGNVMKHIVRYLSLNSTQDKLGVDAAARGQFESCSEDTALLFEKSGDLLGVSYHYITALLERGIRVLAYNGDYDFIVNAPGTQRYTDALEWSGASAYRATTLQDWEVDGKPAGKWRSAHGLTFATIHAAGHMAPYDKPKESLALFQRWIDGGKF